MVPCYLLKRLMKEAILIERQSYTYEGNKIKISRSGTLMVRKDSTKCLNLINAPDYLSVLSMIRNIDFSGMKRETANLFNLFLKKDG